MKGVTHDDPKRRRIGLAGLLIIAALIGLRGIGDEASVMLGGDMARYVMNGVFVHDLIADGGVTSYEALTQYAEHYYARYPALSLGHHPPIPYLSLVPFYWVFGVSIFAVRIAALVWFLGAAWGLYAVAGRLFSRETAMWTTVEAVQVHGGYGFVKEYHVERLMRDAKITQIYEGTSEVQRIVISRYILK